MQEFGATLAAFSRDLPRLVPSFCEPSLPFLARYWVDVNEDVQESARATLDFAVERMEEPMRRHVVTLWARRLRSGGINDQFDIASPAGIAVLIVGLMTSKYKESVEKNVKLLLIRALRTLLNGPPAQQALGAELFAMGFAVWQNDIEDIEDLVTQLLSLSRKNDVNEKVSPFTRCLMTIASVRPPLFLNLIGSDEGIRAGNIRAATMLMRWDSNVLLPHLILLTETVLKYLNPHTPEIRNRSVGDATETLKEMIFRFPQISFHTTSQKLACGTVSGGMVIFDVRHATRWMELLSHAEAITAIAFSPSGDQVVSFCEKERMLRFWNIGSSILQMITSRRFSSRSHCVKEIEIPIDVCNEGSRLDWSENQRVALLYRSRVLFQVGAP
eukprot:c5365_g1_i1.p1 GENE.c5365_g1_i1~~c5365_g1_i1.p1  ORF type:complete len:393 (+),score=94.61 c5365_g1_i1:24-1181(+)